LAPDLDFLIEVVKGEYGIRQEELFYSRRGNYNEARNVAIYLVRKLRGDRLKEIGEVFGIGKYSTVSSAVQRVKVGIERDERLRKRISHLIATIAKGQG
jgi:chromosomal replication initiation ATPase DnaA